MLVLVISYASSMRAWLQQRDDIAAANAEISRSQVSIDSLERTQSRWFDDAYIEAQARQRLGWVLPGEVGYRVIGEDGQTLGDSPTLSDPDAGTPPDQTTWYQALWGSVEEAGRDPAAEQPATKKDTPRPPDLINPPSAELPKNQ